MNPLKRLALSHVLLWTSAFGLWPAVALEPAPEGTFSVVVIPDTQGYLSGGKRAKAESEGPLTNPVFEAHITWILENRDTQRIAFVSHVGDIVDRNVEGQWEVARTQMDRLHGRVPYGIVVGNHDMKSSGDSTLFQRYFPAERFRAFSWYGGTYAGDPEQPGHSGNNANSVQIISAGGLDLVLLHIECNAPDAVLTWADEVLGRHRDRIALISTHMDLGPAEKPEKDEDYFLAPKGRMNWKKCHGEAGNTPVQLWDKLYRKWPNLLMVFSGDQSRTSAYYLPRTGDHGNTVHGLLSDYTSSGPLRIYRFNPAAGEIRVITWDTTKGELVEDSTHVKGRENHQFAIPHDFAGSAREN